MDKPRASSRCLSLQCPATYAVTLVPDGEFVNLVEITNGFSRIVRVAPATVENIDRFERFAADKNDLKSKIVNATRLAMRGGRR